MTRQAAIVIGALAVLVAALAVTLGVVLATDDDDGMSAGDMTGGMGGMDGNDAFMGMMMSMGSGDSDQMLAQMKEILGEDRFNSMMQHFQDHQNGMMTGDFQIDGMMHQMMDGMMQDMPRDSGGNLPSGSDQHHMTPVAGTPTS